MNVKLKTLTAGVLFFTGQALMAQETKDSLQVEKSKEIEEIVVVGYSRVKKSDYVGTVSKVDMGSVKNKNVSSATQALAGESAGVQIVSSTGQPGQDPTIRIRGFGSVNGNRNPLYVVDGVPFSGSISSINPEDIDNYTILKDATATAIYGSRGANGVIVITTKSGRANRDFIQLESKVGINTQLLPRYDVITSPEEYIELSWSALYHQGVANKVDNPIKFANDNLFGENGISPAYNMWKIDSVADLIDPETGKVRSEVERKYTPENWAKKAFRPAVRTEHNLNMGGGSGKTTYYAGIGYLKDEGYSINSNFERYTGRLNLGFRPKKWLSGTFNMGYAHTKSRNNGQSEDSSNVFWFSDNIPAIYPLYLRDENGNKVPDPHFGGFIFDYGNRKRGFGALTNAVADATYDKDGFTRHELNANLFLKADITSGLSFETRLGGQYFNNSRDRLRNPFYGGSAGEGGSLTKIKSELFTWTFLQMLRYNKRFGGHGIDAFVAHESTKWENKVLGATKNGLISPYITEFNNAVRASGAPESYINDYALDSYFGQLNYDYDGKYIVSSSIRRDGSSRFLKGNRYDIFPSLGIGWVVSKENFLKGSKMINNLKLKASYGFVGDQAGVGFYPGYDVYGVDNVDGDIATPFQRSGYPNLTWEKSKMFQTGVEFILFNRRLEGSVDFYNKLTDQLIFDSRLAPSTGDAILKVNDGKLLNQGIEFNLVGHIVRTENFFLDLSVNGEVMRNKILEMPFDNATRKRKILDLSEGGYGRAEGHSIYDFYMREWAGVDPNTGAARWWMNYEDRIDPITGKGNGRYDDGEEILSLTEFLALNPNAVISETITEDYNKATQKFVGKSIIPDVRGAINLNLGYKGFTLGAQMLYSIGGYVYDSAYADLMGNHVIGENNWHTNIRNRWQNPGDITNVPRYTSNRTLEGKIGDNLYSERSTRFLTRADYFLLNNVNIGYSLSKDMLNGTGLQEVKLTLSADNLWIHSARKGLNPTTGETGASNSYRYAPVSNFTFGLRVKF